MKIKYTFVTGEKVEIEVNNEFSEIMVELESEIKNNDRKETRRHEGLDLSDKNHKNNDLNTDICGKVLKNLDKDKLYAALTKLTPQEQDLIHKLYLDKNSLSQLQYSKIIDTNENSVKQRAKRIRIKLKKLLQNN